MAPTKANGKRKMDQGDEDAGKIVRVENKEVRECDNCKRQTNEGQNICSMSCGKELVFKLMQVVTCSTDKQALAKEAIRTVEEKRKKNEEEKNTTVTAVKNAQRKIDETTAELKALEEELNAEQAKKVQGETELNGCLEACGLKNWYSGEILYFTS